MLDPQDLESLVTLLSTLFTDSGGLQRFIAMTPGAERLVAELPGGPIGLDAFAFESVRSLASHGLLQQQFFARLLAERPLRIADIEPVARQFGVTLRRGGESAPASVRPRAAGGAVELLRRFIEEPGGERRLIGALQEQVIVGQDADLAARLAVATELLPYGPGEALLVQDASDTDILFILAGEAAIVVHGREVAVRRAGQHVGEMAMIDPRQSRSATVIARTEVVVARVTEDRFTRIAEACPRLWRRLAVELGARLRERAGLVRPRSSRPRLFIGSTDAGLPIARGLAAALQDPLWEVRVWRDGPAGLGKSSLESLAAQAEELDFGLLVVAPPDLAAPDGNGGCDELSLQLGALIGALGRERVFVGALHGARDEWLGTARLAGARRLDVVEMVDGSPRCVASVAAEFRSIVEHHLSR